RHLEHCREDPNAQNGRTYGGHMMHDDQHRSWRLTPPAYMRGKKVKRRMLWVAITIAVISTVSGCVAAFMVALLPWNAPKGKLALILVAGTCAFLATAWACVRMASVLKLLSPRE